MPENIKKALHFVIFDLIETVVISLAIFVVIYIFIASPHIVVGHSMDTSFADGEFLLVNEFLYHFQQPQRGDPIVFKFDATHDFIKRIIGLPGDHVYLHGGYVYLNGKKIDEPYVTKGNLTYGLDFLRDDTQITVPANEYFVLGDNRDESSDSREWGFVDKSAIHGKVFVIIWPPQEMHIVPSYGYTPQGNDLVAQTK